MAKRPFFATHHITIDASQRGSSICIAMAGAPISEAKVWKVGGVELIGGFEPLLELAAQANDSQGRDGPDTHGRDALATPLVLIEKPEWFGQGTFETRSAGTAWAAHLQRLFPKRRVTTVDPRDWQNALFGRPKDRVHPDNTKLQSLWYVAHVLKRVDVADTFDDDLADALCMLAYLRIKERLR